MSLRFKRAGSLPAHSLYALQVHAAFAAVKACHGQLNSFLAQVITSLTASLRFYCTLNVSVAEFQTNLVPYLRIHSCFAPTRRLLYEKAFRVQLSVAMITMIVFELAPMMVKRVLRYGKYTALRLIVVPKDVDAAVATVQTKCTI